MHRGTTENQSTKRPAAARAHDQQVDLIAERDELRGGDADRNPPVDPIERMQAIARRLLGAVGIEPNMPAPGAAGLTTVGREPVSRRGRRARANRERGLGLRGGVVGDSDDPDLASPVGVAVGRDRDRTPRRR